MRGHCSARAPGAGEERRERDYSRQVRVTRAKNPRLRPLHLSCQEAGGGEDSLELDTVCALAAGRERPLAGFVLGAGSPGGELHVVCRGQEITLGSSGGFF